jgi:hypothetical protein
MKYVKAIWSLLRAADWGTTPSRPKKPLTALRPGDIKGEVGQY